MRVAEDDLTLTLSLARAIEKAGQANVQLLLLNPEDAVRARLSQDVLLGRRQKRLVVRLRRPFENVPAQEMKMPHWLRLQYEVTTGDGEILASGIEAMRGATTDPFVLTAAASQVAPEGLPYRAGVHVKSSDGRPLAGVEVNGGLVWDENEVAGKEHMLSVKATTGVSGDATLEFSIPREIHAEDGDLISTVRVWSALSKGTTRSTATTRCPIASSCTCGPKRVVRVSASGSDRDLACQQKPHHQCYMTTTIPNHR